MDVSGILLWVQDNKISEKFYKKIGFEITKSDDEISIAKLNNFQITLVTMRDEAEFSNDSLAAEKGKGAYVYIKTNDVDEYYSRLLKAGIKQKSKPRNWDWGNREFVVKDPDGYKFCFWHEIAK